jgi:2-keto-4-pentenoate hydratase/2-oxohepta-3-ene-1,7-dioic acid hydratase in catechol pathway
MDEKTVHPLKHFCRDEITLYPRGGIRDLSEMEPYVKLVTFVSEGGSALPGVLDGDVVMDLSAAGYSDTLQVIVDGDAAKAKIAAAKATARRLPLAQVTLLAPMQRPPRIFGIGLNYKAHAAESNMKTQAVPTVFLKLSSSVVGTGAEIVLPKNASQPDYEAELAVVIGEGGYRIAAEDWEKHVFGYTICNDVSARDIQLSTTQWTLGKSFPTFTPLGPSIVTRDEIADPHALDIELQIDGETLQKANTRDLIFRIPQLIEYLSSITPLEPGDVISTGTPEGVGMGRTPQRWMRPNEEVVITIAGLGELRNGTVAEA